jgi:predicted ATP-dependent Lon-type protease
MEFLDVHFSYIDMEKMEEKFISVPEQGGGGTTFCGSSRRVRGATGHRSIDD